MPRWNSYRTTESSQRFGNLLIVLAVLGCSTGTVRGLDGRTLATARSRTLEHEPCDQDSTSTEKTDVNGDGRPDLAVTKDDGKEICRSADLDFDGRVDLWSYFDQAGRVRRRELDYDRDGISDELQLFKAGELVEKHRASTPARRIDTWEFYSAGRLVRAERDSDGDGHVDQWWDYKTQDCPLIRTDADGNGQPDPKAEVDYCKESGYKPPEQAAPTVAPMLQKDTASLPTETSNKVEPSNSDGAEAAPSPSPQKPGQKDVSSKSNEKGAAK